MKRDRLYAVWVQSLGQAWTFVAHVIAPTAKEAESLIRPTTALDHWHYEAREVKARNGTVFVHRADQVRLNIWVPR